MKFKIDENLPVEFAEVLQSEGWDAVTVLDEEMSGASDMDIFAICSTESRALISLDMDFTDIRLYPPLESPGILVFRIQPQDKEHLLDVLKKIIPLMKEKDLTRSLWIVEEDRIRIRGDGEE